MTNMSKRKKSFTTFKGVGDHDEFLHRITKTLYYAKLPTNNCLTLPMTEFAAELFTEVKKDHTLQRLEIEEASRISRNACVSPCSMVLALLYIERLKDCNPEYLKRVANSELFLVTLLVASKFLHDDGEYGEVLNTDWANSGDVSVLEMNRLEQEFLQAIDWSVFIKAEDFWNKLKELEKKLAYKEAQKRGWFSYTELNSLLESAQIMSMISYILNVYTVVVAAYTAGLMTLIGSALIASYIPGTALSSSQNIQADIFPTHNGTRNSFLLEDDDTMCEDCTLPVDSNLNFTSEVQNAEWWLDSMMDWLPIYSGLNEVKEHYKSRPSLMITRVEFDDSFLHEKDLAFNTEYRDNIQLSLTFLLTDWRYYLSSISKLALVQ